MEKIKFRAKSIKDKKCIHSSSIEFEKVGGLALPQPYLLDKDSGYFTRCIPGTVQQFTRMYDFDGNEIYEVDIIQCLSFPNIKYVVIWHHGCWMVKSHTAELDDEFEILYEALKIFKFNIVGNIIDNPDLMEEK